MFDCCIQLLLPCALRPWSPLLYTWSSRLAVATDPLGDPQIKARLQALLENCLAAWAQAASDNRRSPSHHHLGNTHLAPSLIIPGLVSRAGTKYPNKVRLQTAILFESLPMPPLNLPAGLIRRISKVDPHNPTHPQFDTIGCRWDSLSALFRTADQGSWGLSIHLLGAGS